jgi:heptosyltransferase-3
MVKRILIVRPDKIGDLILTLPMASVIKSAMRDTHVAFLVRDYTAPLLELAPDVDEVVIYDPSWSLGKTITFLRRTKADAIFFFGSKFKLTVAAFFARIPNRIGRAYWWYSFLYNKKIYEHRKNAERNEADYNVRMLRAISIDIEETPLPILNHVKLPEISLPHSEYIVLHAGTGGSTRAWSEEHFIELAQRLNQKYIYPIFLTGTPSDNEFLFRISQRMKLKALDVHILTQNTLLELAAVLSRAKLVVSCGTGPGHLSAALGTPTIGLFPNVVPLSKIRWGLRGIRAVNLSPENMPKAECPQCNDCTCIDEILPSQVMTAIDNLNISI